MLMQQIGRLTFELKEAVERGEVVVDDSLAMSASTVIDQLQPIARHRQEARRGWRN